MPTYEIPFRHVIHEKHLATVEAKSLEEALNKLKEDPFEYTEEGQYETQGIRIEYLTNDIEEIQED